LTHLLQLVQNLAALPAFCEGHSSLTV